uniref:Uncharacterized protein n=1 Tax=Heterosigma akashiwo TaxID=2829 RepID=A0A7S4DAW9_HETAK
MMIACPLHPPLPFSVIYSRPELFPPSNQWPIKKDSLMKIQKEKSEKIQCAVLRTHARLLGFPNIENPLDFLLEDVEKQSKKEPLKACRPISTEENAVLIKYFKLLLKINEKVVDTVKRTPGMDVHERVRDLLDRAWDHVGGKDYSLKDMKVITSKMETVITNNVEVANWPNDVPSPGFVAVFNSVQVSDKDKEEAKQKADATQCDGINANNQRCSATWGTLKAQGEVMFGVLIPKRCAAHKQRLDRPFCSFCAADRPNTATQYWWKEYDPAEGLDQATFFAGGSNWGDIVSRDSSFPYDNICDTCGQEETFKGKLFLPSSARTIYSNFVKKEQEEKKKRKALGRVWKQQQKRLRGETCNHGSGDCPNPVGFHFSDQTFAVGEGPPSRHCAEHKMEGMVDTRNKG